MLLHLFNQQNCVEVSASIEWLGIDVGVIGSVHEVTLINQKRDHAQNLAFGECKRMNEILKAARFDLRHIEDATLHVDRLRVVTLAAVDAHIAVIASGVDMFAEVAKHACFTALLVVEGIVDNSLDALLHALLEVLVDDLG